MIYGEHASWVEHLSWIFSILEGMIHQFDSFTHGTPFQEGIAMAFEQAEVSSLSHTKKHLV